MDGTGPQDRINSSQILTPCGPQSKFFRAGSGCPPATSGTTAAVSSGPEAATLIPQDVTMDLDLTASLIAKAQRALSADGKAACLKHIGIALSQAKGVLFDDRTQDVPLAEARNAIALAKKALEKNDGTSARSRLAFARSRLRVNRELLSGDERHEVDRLLAEIEQLEKRNLQGSSSALDDPSPRGK